MSTPTLTTPRSASKHPETVESDHREKHIITGCGRTPTHATTGDHVQQCGRPSLDDRWPGFLAMMSESGLVKFDDLAMIREGMDIASDRCDERVFQDDFEASNRIDKLIQSRLNRRRRRENRKLKHSNVSSIKNGNEEETSL